MLVVREGDDKGLTADNLGDTGVGHCLSIPLHLIEVEKALHDVAVSREELRVVLFSMEGISERLERFEWAADGLAPLHFPNKLIVPKVIEVIAGVGVMTERSGVCLVAGDRGRDRLLAVAVVTETRKASISYVQRRLKIGYNRAARMIEEMETSGVVSMVQANGSREVLAPPPPTMD